MAECARAVPQGGETHPRPTTYSSPPYEIQQHRLTIYLVLLLAARAGARIYANPTKSVYQSTEQEYAQKIAAKLPAAHDYTGEDVLDGAITLSAISFGIGAYDAALSRSPVELHEFKAPPSGHGKAGWEAICVVQGTLLRGRHWRRSSSHTLCDGY